jgi:hypothetical protein
MSDDTCPICGIGDATMGKMDRNSSIPVECKNCGAFGLTTTAASILKATLNDNLEKRAILSYWVYRYQQQGRSPLLKSEAIERIFAQESLPSLSEQASNLILALGEAVQHPGGIERLLHPMHWTARVGAFDDVGVYFLTSSLMEQGIITASRNTRNFSNSTLSYAGWQEFDSLRRGKTAGRLAFMAMPFGEPEIQLVFESALRPASARAGFKLRRLDENPEAGVIDNRMRAEIRRSHFLVADLTHANRGAYWEAGFAEGLGKPVIYTCERSRFDAEPTHFDTNHSHTIQWNLDNLSKAEEDLVNTIRATLPADAVMDD